MDFNKDFENEVNELIEKMTIEEKVMIIHGNGLFRTEEVERLGIKALVMSDGPMGVRKEFQNDNWEEIGNSDDYVTYLPSNSALASTWNDELAYKSGYALGEEARGRGKDVILAPGINIMRTPLCGRNFEYMSEDPYLISKMVVPFIKGIQENDVAACVKHYALNNQETERGEVNVEVDERALREIYLRGFEAAIKEGKSYSIMSAYNRFRGKFCSHSSYLLDEILRKEWNFDGVVISDWGAVHDTEEAALGGLDIEMSVTSNFDDYYFAKPLIKAVKEGKIEESIIDEKVKRVLMLMNKVKMFSNDRYKGAYNTPEHRQAALEVAREATVLLKNDKGILPLDEKKIKTIAVIGENANKLHSNGGGSAEIKALYEISPLMGIKMVLGGNVQVNFAKGYSSKKHENIEGLSKEAIEVAEKFENQKLMDEALEVAKCADAVIFVGGLNHDYDSEGFDKKDMKLPFNQDELIEKLLKVNKNTIVTIINGSPVEMVKWIDNAPAVLQSSYAGIENGYALAEILFGYVNPSGKLPVSYPKVLEDSPAHKIGEYPGDKAVEYKEGLFVGYRYYDSYDVEPLFCFGHGLSYTKFEYSNLKVNKENLNGDLEVNVKLNIKNIGDYEGSEVVQIYVSDKEASAQRPKKELKAFKKVKLNPMESKEVELTLNENSFSYYDDKKREWILEKGEFEILVGSSSRDIRLSENIVL